MITTIFTDWFYVQGLPRRSEALRTHFPASTWNPVLMRLSIYVSKHHALVFSLGPSPHLPQMEKCGCSSSCPYLSTRVQITLVETSRKNGLMIEIVIFICFGPCTLCSKKTQLMMGPLYRLLKYFVHIFSLAVLSASSNMFSRNSSCLAPKPASDFQRRTSLK